MKAWIIFVSILFYISLNAQNISGRWTMSFAESEEVLLATYELIQHPDNRITGSVYGNTQGVKFKIRIIGRYNPRTKIYQLVEKEYIFREVPEDEQICRGYYLLKLDTSRSGKQFLDGVFVETECTRAKSAIRLYRKSAPVVTRKPVATSMLPDCHAPTRKIQIYFAPNQSQLSPEARKTIQQVLQKLKHCPRMHVKITAFADQTYDKAYELRLSRDRAIRIKQFLLDHNIAPQRIQIAWQGFSPNPKARSDRRAEIELYSK